MIISSFAITCFLMLGIASAVPTRDWLAAISGMTVVVITDVLQIFIMT